MKNSKEFDKLLKQALTLNVEPSEDLNKKIIDQLKEKKIMKPIYKRKIGFALIAVALTLTVSMTALATWNFLQPKQVAQYLENPKLAAAFEDHNAIAINKQASSGGYHFNLLGIVSGEGLSDFVDSAQDVHQDRTYAVVSISKEDGSQMPATQDAEYSHVPFFVSPLIKGQKPWEVNIASMNGSYSELVIDGIMYRLIECDGVEIFADRGLYLSINTGSFYNVNAFDYNEETGEITPTMNYDGANVLFDLPLDIGKADYERAEKYLQELLEEEEEGEDADSSHSDEVDIDLEDALANAVVIPESIKEVTYNEKGHICYEYEEFSFSNDIGWIFYEDEVGLSDAVTISEDGDGNRTALRFSRDSDGVITGMVFILD